MLALVYGQGLDGGASLFDGLTVFGCGSVDVGAYGVYTFTQLVVGQRLQLRAYGVDAVDKRLQQFAVARGLVSEYFA